MGLYAEIAGELVKVVDQNTALPGLNGPRTPIELEIFHESMSGNSIAFSTLIVDFSDPFSVGEDRMIRATLGLDYGDFSDPAGLVLNGDATTTASTLRLTDDVAGQAGSAFFGSAWDLEADTSFSSTFEFRIDGQNNGGVLGSDGFAFVLHGDPDGANAIGNSGEGLGFGTNDTTATPVDEIAPSLAIEFDTHANIFDPDGNHVAVIVDGDMANHLAIAAPMDLLNSGDVLTAWINYDGATDLLEVFLSADGLFPGVALLSTTIDLLSALGPQAFFGFTAGTGDGFNSHEILSWALTVSPRSIPGAAVPEPATGALLALGIFALSLSARRRRQG